MNRYGCLKTIFPWSQVLCLDVFLKSRIRGVFTVEKPVQCSFVHEIRRIRQQAGLQRLVVGGWECSFRRPLKQKSIGKLIGQIFYSIPFFIRPFTGTSHSPCYTHGGYVLMSAIVCVGIVQPDLTDVHQVQMLFVSFAECWDSVLALFVRQCPQLRVFRGGCGIGRTGRGTRSSGRSRIKNNTGIATVRMRIFQNQRYTGDDRFRHTFGATNFFFRIGVVRRSTCGTIPTFVTTFASNKFANCTFQTLRIVYK